MNKIPVLFTAENSLYLNDDRFDCFGIKRDAMTWTGAEPAIYHPPCRLFSKLRAFSNAGKCEKLYGYYSIMSARKLGGVVEHPVGSTLFKEMGCDMSGKKDIYGGYLRKVNLSWFGFPAKKETLLYIVGCPENMLPAHPISFDAVFYEIRLGRKRKGARKKYVQEKTQPNARCYDQLVCGDH